MMMKISAPLVIHDDDEIDDDEVKTLMVVMTPSLAWGKRALLSPAWELPP